MKNVIVSTLLLTLTLCFGITSALAAKKKSHLFPDGYCTYYVADNNPKYVAYIKFSGNANKWLDNARSSGYKTKDRGWKPKKYSVVVMDYAPLGHVALVVEVKKSGEFRIIEMNYKGWKIPSDDRWFKKDDKRIMGFILTKKAIEQYEDDDNDKYKKLKKQYKKKDNDIWYDGMKQNY